MAWPLCVIGTKCGSALQGGRCAITKDHVPKAQCPLEAQPFEFRQETESQKEAPPGPPPELVGRSWATWPQGSVWEVTILDQSLENCPGKRQLDIPVPHPAALPHQAVTPLLKQKTQLRRRILPYSTSAHVLEVIYLASDHDPGARRQ